MEKLPLRCRQLIVVIGLALAPFIAQAQSPDSANTGGNSFSRFLGAIFSPKPTKLSGLIDAKQLKKADEYLSAEKQYFVENKTEHLPLLQRLATELNAVYEPQMTDAEQGLSKVRAQSVDSWKEIRDATETADSLMNEYKAFHIFKENEFRSLKLSSLENALTKTHTELIQGASTAFQQFDHSAEVNFFAVYPEPLNGSAFLADNANALQRFVNSLSVAQLAQIKAKYSEHIGNAEKFNDLLSSRFFTARLATATRPYSIGQVLDTVKAARAAGFNAKTLPGAKIAFVEVTSRTLLKEGQIEFPSQVEMDLPFDPVKVELDEVFDTAEKTGADYFIILDVAASKVDRRITAKNDLTSRYVSGRRNDPNPAYEIARARMFETQSGLANAQGQYTYGLAAGLLKILIVADWSTQVEKARQSFSQTPATVSVDLYEPYKYSTSDIKTTRTMTANYYVIDKVANRYFKGIFDIAENKAFRIAYNTHDNDPERGGILGQFEKETDILAFEQSPMTLKASLLVEDYLKNQAQSQPMKSIVELREEMLTDKNKALTAYKSEQFNAKPVNDARFDSVVVILNPNRGVGAGFYVAPDLVMTNYHVIESAQFVEMKLYNGMETFGKVVKTDVRLDLALVRVQTRGNPVSFFEGNTLNLGATVEAIGHPKGLTFTITRGIVSAVRKKQSLYAVGGKDVMFVQTDASINPGNSGGPLFLNEKVIGVNNNKLVAGSEGLGFAVHYSEVMTFMKESF